MTESKTDTIKADIFNQLITRAYDAGEGYAFAAEQTSNEPLHEWFLANSRQRASFVSSLKEGLRKLGKEPEEGASVSGKAHQAFIKIRATMSPDTDLALIEECRRGEEQTLDNYQEAIELGKLDDEASELIKNQKEAVETHLEALTTIESALIGPKV